MSAVVLYQSMSRLEVLIRAQNKLLCSEFEKSEELSILRWLWTLSDSVDLNDKVEVKVAYFIEYDNESTEGLSYKTPFREFKDLVGFIAEYLKNRKVIQPIKIEQITATHTVIDPSSSITEVYEDEVSDDERALLVKQPVHEAEYEPYMRAISQFFSDQNIRYQPSTGRGLGIVHLSDNRTIRLIRTVSVGYSFGITTPAYYQQTVFCAIKYKDTIYIYPTSVFIGLSKMTICSTFLCTKKDACIARVAVT
jgi:hypothetical protein